MLAKRMKSSHPGSRNVHHYKASSTHTLLDPQALCTTKKSGYNHAATIRGTTTISCCGEIFGALKSHVIVASRNLTPKRQLSNGILSWPKFRVKYYEIFKLRQISCHCPFGYTFHTDSHADSTEPKRVCSWAATNPLQSGWYNWNSQTSELCSTTSRLAEGQRGDKIRPETLHPWKLTWTSKLSP